MIVVKINGLREVQAKIAAIPANLQKRADAIIQGNVLKMVNRAKRDAPVDMGRLKGGITAKKNGVANWSMVSQDERSPYLEFGTKGRYRPIPGIDASQFKGTGGKAGGRGFFDNILKWVKRKGISGSYSVKSRKRVGKKLDQQLEDEQTAWAIYLSIMRHGIKAQPFFFKQAPIQEPQIMADFSQLVKEQGW